MSINTYFLLLSIILVSCISKENRSYKYNNKGITFLFKKNKKALKLFKKSIKLKPENYTAISNYGLALELLDKDEESLIYFDKATFINPLYDTAYYNKGNALMDLNQYSDAIVCYTKCLEMNVNWKDYGLFTNSAICHYLLKNYENALILINKSLMKDNNKGITHYYKALILLEIGNELSACESFKKAKELGWKDIEPNLENLCR